jgi:membrane fusion protein, multidrug efflux system
MDAGLEPFRKKLRFAVACGGLVGGGGLCAVLVLTASPPPRRMLSEALPDVAVVAIEPRVESTPVTGHGAVRAKSQVDVIPLVSGKLIQVHRNLLPGKIIPKGELLFEIDPTVYDARLRQAEAEVQGLSAALQRHEQELTSLKDREQTGLEMLAIDERDLQTSRNLYDVQKVGTQRDLDLVHQKYLRQKDLVAEVQSRIAMIPHVRAETEAKLEAARAQLKQAQHDLSNTKIECPFKARIEAIQAHNSQVVTAHFAIAKLTDMEAFEVSVGIDPRDLRWLAPAVRPEALEGDQAEQGPPVQVSWSLHGQSFTWTGHVTRFERVDEVTRTARMVVEVREAEMLARVSIGEQQLDTSLSIGMYVKADLPVSALEGALLVPRHAIYDNEWVYVFVPASEGADQGRLARRRTPMLRSVGDEVLVDYSDRRGTAACELKAGDRVVVSPLLKPVDGMQIRLRNTADSLTDASQADSSDASGESVRTAAVAVLTALEPRAGRGAP